MEEKCEAEQRAANAARATSEIRSEMERVRNRADEVIRASEQETEALRANAVETTAAWILEEIDSKYCPTVAAGTRPGLATLDDEPVRKDLVVDAGIPSSVTMCAPGGGKKSLVAEIHRRFDTAYETVRAARAHAATSKTEMERVRREAAADAEVALLHQRESSAALVAEIRCTARQEAAAAADKVAASEAALRTAKEEVERLRGELRRAQATEAAARAATDGDKSESIRKIAQLEDELREANLEHERSRQQSELELEVLRETLERNEEAGGAARVVQGGYAAAVREDKATPSAAAAAAEEKEEEEKEEEEAAVAAATDGAIDHRCLQETSMLELRGAEEAVMEAKNEVEYLRRELMRTAETAARSKTLQEAAETKLAEMEGMLKGAAREHTLFRARAEDRLLTLRAPVEENNQENGVQVRV